MNIESVETYRYTLPLVEALRIKDSTLAVRSGLLVKVTSDNGASAFGEIAPLPAYSRESLEDARLQVESLAASLSGQAVPEGLERLDGGFETWLSDKTSAASVRFGFELAVLNLLAADRGVHLRQLLSEDPLEVVPVSGLLSGNLGEIRRKAQYLKEAGYTAVKLKVGRYDLATDVQTTTWLCEHFGNDMAVHLDANRAWDFATAFRFVREIVDCGVEYIEEPTHEFGRLTELIQTTGVKLALDETLQDVPVETFRPVQNLRAVILKPTVLGLEKAVRIGRQALALRVTPVISSTYESGFGLCALAEIAAAVQPPDAQAGLDTYEWLDADVLRTRPPLRGSELKPADLTPFTASFDEARVQKLESA